MKRSSPLCNFDVALLSLALALVLPFLGLSNYAMRTNIQVLINATLSMSLTATMGLAGITSLGQAGFFAIGAYSAALLNVHFSLPFFLTIPLAGLITGIVGLLVAIPSLRIKGMYFALTTFAFGEMVRLLAINWRSLTRGVMGIPGIGRPMFRGHVFGVRGYYYLALLIAALAYVVFNHLKRSDFGLACAASVDNYIAATALGIDVSRLRLVAAAFASFWTGIVGGFYAHYYGFVSPAPFNSQLSLLIMVMAILSHVIVTSLRIRRGYLASIVVALVLTWIPELLRFLRDYRMVFYGGTILLVIYLKPYLTRLGDTIENHFRRTAA